MSKRRRDKRRPKPFVPTMGDTIRARPPLVPDTRNEGQTPERLAVDLCRTAASAVPAKSFVLVSKASHVTVAVFHCTDAEAANDLHEILDDLQRRYHPAQEAEDPATQAEADL